MKKFDAIIAETELVVINKLTVLPEKEKDFLSVVKKFAEATRADKGNISFDLLKISGQDLQFSVFERYENQEAFDKHLAQPYAAECFGALPGLLSHPMGENLIVVKKINL